MFVKCITTITFFTIGITLFTAVETRSEARRFRKAEDQMPMPVVDLIEQGMADGTVKEGNKNRRLIFFPVPAVFILSILTGLSITYLYLKYWKSLNRETVNTVTKPELKQGDSSLVHSEENRKITISDREAKHSNQVLSTPIARSLRLKMERKKHAREINRLMSKI